MKTRMFLLCLFGLIFILLVSFAPKLAVWFVGLTALVSVVLLLFGTTASPKQIRKNLLKALLSIVLVAAVLGASSPRVDARPDDDGGGGVVAVCACVLVVGGVVCYGLWKLCQRIPSPNAQIPPPPPPTNYPPVILTNRPTMGTNVHRIRMANLNAEAGITAQNIAAYHMPDVVGGGEFHTIWRAEVQESMDLQEWTPSLSMTGWVSQAGEQVAFYTNGSLAAHVRVMPGAENYIPIELVEKRRAFYRMAVQ